MLSMRLGEFSTALSVSQEAALRRRCDEVLHYVWDPLGVCDVPEARDEYDFYLPEVYSFLQSGATAGAIREYLLRIEQKRMGTEGKLARATEVAEILVAWRDFIFGEES